jgi:hypothetical protein
VKWDSHNGKQADPSLKSFLFPLRNRYYFGARKFPLRDDAAKDDAICCDARCGPNFRDIWVCDGCNARNRSFSTLGRYDVNDTGLDEKTVFTGSLDFTVKEIEVFEITN